MTHTCAKSNTISGFMLLDRNIFSGVSTDAKTTWSTIRTIHVSEATVITSNLVGFYLHPAHQKKSYNRNVTESRSENARIGFSIWNELRHGSKDFHIYAGWSRWHLTSGLALQTATPRQCAWHCYLERRRNGCADKWQTCCVQTFVCECCPASCVFRFVLTLA
jgi:hypothetical protein